MTNEPKRVKLTYKEDLKLKNTIKKIKTRLITIRLDDKQYNLLKEVQRDSNSSVSAVVREALTHHFSDSLDKATPNP